MDNIRELKLEALKKWIAKQGEKAFRASQIFEWIWQKGITDFGEMSNVPAGLRQALSENFVFHEISTENVQHSNDGTIKALFKLHDAQFIEGVIIPSDERVTICISSQVGCKLKCTFCATGTIGFKRNLDAGEIFDQVHKLNEMSVKAYKKTITNIVFMGMGEPLYNYENVKEAIHRITSPVHGLGISARRITLSTIGIPVMIKKMADDDVKFNLAVSLHAAMQTKRVGIMPVARNHTLEMLLDALKYFTEKTGQKVTFEYVLLKGVNDSKADAEAIVRIGSKLANKINLIEYNPVEGAGFEKSSAETTQQFIQMLKDKGMYVNLRKSRGEDIDAACGQLANKMLVNK
jgi:23S rRNA (adenine2503-C2)-methyltransferase